MNTWFLFSTVLLLVPNGRRHRHAQLGFEHWAKRSGFVIYLVLRMHQFQKCHLLSCLRISYQYGNTGFEVFKRGI